MNVKGDPKSDGAKGYMRSGLEDREKVLYRTKALLSQSKSPEEFHNKINTELNQLLEIKNGELEKVGDEKDVNKKRKEEKRINNKYNFRKDAFAGYLPPKKEAKPEPKQNQEVSLPKAPIEAQASTDGKEPSKNPTELENDAAETSQKTNGPVYSNESLSDDMREDLERVKNGNKADKSGNDHEVEQKNYKQEWQRLHEKIKQAEKQK